MPCLEHLASLAFTCVGATRIRKLKRRRTREIKHDLHLASFVDIRLHGLTLGNPHRGEGMNGLADMDGCLAFRGLVADARDDKVAGSFRQTLEVCRGRLRIALRAIKSVGHFEGRGAHQGVLDALADAVFGACFEGVNRGCVVELDLDRWTACLVDSPTATSVADLADPDGLAAELEALPGDLDVGLLLLNVPDYHSLGVGAALMLDLELDGPRGGSGEFDGDPLFDVLIGHASLVRLTRLDKLSRGSGVHTLLEEDWLELLVVIV